MEPQPGSGPAATRKGARAGVRARVSVVIATLSLLVPLAARAELELPAVLGDHMVLQQGTAAVWGWAEPGSTITVSLAGKSGTGVTGEDGRWNVLLLALEAGGPYEMQVSGDGARTVADVLVGDVWLGAGQSNMEVPVRASRDGREPIAEADCHQIRLFMVERVASFTPVEDVRGAWRVCTPETARAFSAVGYYFARELHAAMQIPLGIVVSAWGATSIHVWMPGATVPPATAAPAAFDAAQRRAARRAAGDLEFDLSLKDLRFIPKDKRREEVPVLLQASAAGMGGSWKASAKEGSTATYATIDSPTVRDGGAAGRFTGTLRGAGARAALSTSLSPGQQPVDLTGFAAIALSAKGRGDFRLTLGQASIANPDDDAAEPFALTPEWGAIQLPIDAFKPGGWSASQAFTPEAITSVGFVTSMPEPTAPAVAYNGMILPLTSLRLTGVIWYQGEFDTKAAAHYNRHLSTLIRTWREAWDAQDLAFLVVQLPGYGSTPADPGESDWAQLREAQRQILTLPKTALVTTIDLGDPVDIHPRSKTDVGKRLALAAERLVYGKPVVASGPVLDGVSLANGRIRLRFKDTGGGIVAKDGPGVTGFSVSADGRQFRWAAARIIDPTTLEVWNDSVPNPVEVRYAWADNPACNLFNKEGLPASPFRAALDETVGVEKGPAARPVAP